VGQGERDIGDSQAGGVGGSAAREVQSRSAAREPSDFYLLPGDTAADAGAEGFGSSLFGSEAGCVARGRGAGAGFAVGNLFGGEDAADEASTEALDGSADARNLDEVGAEAEDHDSHRSGKAGRWSDDRIRPR
jgi:hypothetical protein